MSKQATEPTAGLAVASGRRKGFFENLLLSGLGRITHGALRVETDSGSLLLGQEKDEEMRAEIRVADPVFFRKACLGGSLGVADSYASGDWSTPDLGMLFRLFLRNLEVMDGLEGGWATLLNKVARWGCLLYTSPSPRD